MNPSFSPACSPVVSILGFALVALTLCFYLIVKKLSASQRQTKSLYEAAKANEDTRTHLLREIDHRVKNNLVSIMGLLLAEKLEARKNPAIGAEISLDRVSNRIMRLIEVHHMLSESHWAPVSFVEMAKRVLAPDLKSGPKNKRVWLEVAPTSLLVSPRQASSLALILHELTANVVKHVLPHQDNAKIALSAALENEQIRIVFKDDGQGFNDAVARGESQGLGLGLVSQLVVGSLRGSLAFANQGGAIVTLFIKTEEPNRT